MKLAFLLNEESIHSQKWVRYFKGNHEVYVLKIVKTNSKFLDVITNIFSIKTQIKKIKPDILHAHYAGVYGVLGAISGFHPFILTVWGSDILINSKRMIIKPFLNFTLKKADLITCDAEHMKRAIMRLGIPERKIEIINFGIDTKLFAPGPKYQNLIDSLGFSGCDIVISLRRLELICDVETLIKTVPLILKEIPGTKFIIVGAGSQGESILRLSEALKVSKSIKFIGQVSNEEILKYLRISDIYVSTSLSDGGISASTAEAMACGLPAIITDVGDNKDWVKNGESGFIVPIKNPNLLAEKIIYLLKNKDKRLEFGKKARKIIEERNDYNNEMAKIEEIYKLYASKKNNIKKS